MKIKDEKFKQSIVNLEHALNFKNKIDQDPFYIAGIVKNFETCLEYAWKYFKGRAIKEGFDPVSPKESIKYAGRLDIIDNVEKWIDFLDKRNEAVHDYLDISDEEYIKMISDFLMEVKRVD